MNPASKTAARSAANQGPLNSSGAAGPSLGQRLTQDEYIRRRSCPGPWDLEYVVLKDLYRVIAAMAAQVQGRVFDYGCGGAPYRTLFEHCAAYVGADVTPGPSVDRLLPPGGLTAEDPQSYDAVLSTQVLEHVQHPETYLRECQRILKPGGQLILSTHGMIQEHGCPDDYYRWTSRGLETLLTDHGFLVLQSVKFTTELRAVVQLLHQFVTHLRSPGRPFWHCLLAGVRHTYFWFGVPLLNRLADVWPQQAMVPASAPDSLYVGVCVRAQRPPT